MSESLRVAWTRVDVMRRRNVEETVVNCIISEYYRKDRKAIAYASEWLSVFKISLRSPTKSINRLRGHGT